MSAQETRNRRGRRVARTPRSAVPTWALVGALLVAGSGSLLGADILERILVKVNGDIITKTELEERQVSYLRQLRQQGTITSQNTDAELMEALSAAVPRLIVDSINELLLVQRGREIGLAMSDERFTEIVANIKTDNNIESDEDFELVLQQEQMTIDDLRRALERQFIISRVQQIDILSRVAMTETEAREYYEVHPEEYRSPARITLREILIAAPDSAAAESERLNPAVEAQLRARVEAVQRRILAGESFAAIAADVSDAPSKANGGLIGPLDEGDLAEVILEQLEGLSAGEVSEPVRTPLGYQLLQLETATEATRLPFEQVRDDISTRVFTERRNAEFSRYMAELRNQAIIEWQDDELRKAYEAYLNEIESAAQGS